MQPDQADVLDLIARIYAAAENPSLWLQFLRSYQAATHSAAAGFVYRDLRYPSAEFASLVGFDPASVDLTNDDSPGGTPTCRTTA